MRSKLFVGLFLAAIVGISAGEFVFSRIGAQDVPKKEEEKKSDTNLFDVLKKDLDAKKAPELVIPPPVSFSETKPGELPALPGLGVSATQPVPPPVPPSLPPVKEDKTPSVIPPKETTAPKVEEKTALPKPAEPAKIEFPPLEPSKPPVKVDPFPPALEPGIKPSSPNAFEIVPPATTLKPEPAIPPTKAAPPSAPMQPIVAEVAKLKNCPWTLHVEMIDGQTVVMATVNKKHEFKVVCQSLDLQTGKGTLKASGKVQISGDMMTGNCEHLAIALMEDRLVLEGGAAVSIQKTSLNISDARPAAFELKGDRLDLRISELEAGKFSQSTSHKSGTVDSQLRQAAAIAPPLTMPGNWSPYGKLVRLESKLGPSYHLEHPKTGERLQRLVIGQGKSLDNYVGQTISVYGAHERLDGETVTRVTHIALP